MKNIIISGASGFLGTATTKLFLEKGYRVIALVRDEQDSQRLPAHAELKFAITDLSDVKKVQTVISNIIEQNGQVHGCLLLAGGYAGGELTDTSVESIRSQIAMNFETAYNVVQSIYPHFKENGAGRIVLIGSQPPLMPKKATKSVAYALSKSLLFQLAAILNEETKGTNVITHVVVPSTLDTEANRKSMPNADPKKWVAPADLAATLEILCADVSATWREPVIKVYNNAP